jgi:hypothetical protein
VEVSIVVEVDAVSPELSDRITNMLVGMGNSRGPAEDDPMRVQTIYDATRGKLKVILIGSLDTTGSLLKLIKAMVEVET